MNSLSKRTILIPISEAIESRAILNHLSRFFSPETTRLVLIRIADEPDGAGGINVAEEGPSRANEINMPAGVTVQSQVSLSPISPSPKEVTREDDAEPVIFESQIEESLRNEIEDDLDEIAIPLRDVGYETGTVARFGDPADAILAYLDLESNSVDLIAMATAGRSGLDRLLHGSVSEKVLHNCDIPVLLVRSTERD